MCKRIENNIEYEKQYKDNDKEKLNINYEYLSQLESKYLEMLINPFKYKPVVPPYLVQSRLTLKKRVVRVLGSTSGNNGGFGNIWVGLSGIQSSNTSGRISHSSEDSVYSSYDNDDDYIWVNNNFEDDGNEYLNELLAIAVRVRSAGSLDNLGGMVLCKTVTANSKILLPSLSEMMDDEYCGKYVLDTGWVTCFNFPIPMKIQAQMYPAHSTTGGNWSQSIFFYIRSPNNGKVNYEFEVCYVYSQYGRHTRRGLTPNIDLISYYKCLNLLQGGKHYKGDSSNYIFNYEGL